MIACPGRVSSAGIRTSSSSYRAELPKTRIGSGIGPELGINVALAAPNVTGPGVFIYPNYVVNAATYAPFTAACNQILRDPTNGQIGAVDVTYSNSSSVETSGLDVQFDWGTDLAGGNFRLNFLASFLDSFKTKLSPTTAWTEWKGTLGPAGLSGLNSGAFDYRTFTTLSFSRNDWNLGLRWRHLPTIRPSAFVSNPNTFTIDTPSYDAFDLSGGFEVKDNWQLRYGIDNLFDEQPVFTNATRYTRGTTTLGGFYDVLGRRAYVGMSVGF